MPPLEGAGVTDKTRRVLIAGNWKMNGSRAMVQELVSHLTRGIPEGIDSLVIPPFVYLDQAGSMLSGSTVRLGAQDVDPRADGAVTGGVSATMLTDIGCEFALVGHSERRTLFAETDEVVAAKFATCLDAGMTPVLCVGETLDERERNATFDVVSRQLEAVLTAVGSRAFRGAVVAYEPVWAIGTGKSATPDEANEVHAARRSILAEHDTALGAETRILYGGSVNGDNARDLLAMPDIDGALVGGASLKAEEFISICTTAGELTSAG